MAINCVAEALIIGAAMPSKVTLEPPSIEPRIPVDGSATPAAVTAGPSAVPVITTISPGATAPCARLAAFPTDVTAGGGALSEFVSAKLNVGRPDEVAVTLYAPVVAFAVNVVAAAMPLEVFGVVHVLPPPWNVPLGPTAGAVKVTETPAIPLPFASVTVTANALANALPGGAVWGVVPAFAVMLAPTAAPPNPDTTLRNEVYPPGLLLL